MSGGNVSVKGGVGPVHHHCGTNIGMILVLFILLVIIGCTICSGYW
ncbi:sporulation protein YjcZ [Paenibacillus sp. J5C2022]|nr:sporulation protein YjcZ [Paenibacillus sp. J5C2022]